MTTKEAPHQAAVYDAEDALHVLCALPQLAEAEAREFAQRVVLSREWAGQMPPHSPTQIDLVFTSDRRLDSCVSFRFDVPIVQLNLSHRLTKLEVLHELAHVAAGEREGHRELFVWCYLRLVYSFLGSDLYVTLYRLLIEKGARMP